MSYTSQTIFQGQIIANGDATGISSDAIGYAATGGGSTNGYWEIDLGNSSGYGGIRLKNVGGAGQDWEIHAHGTANSVNIEYQNSPILSVNSSRQIILRGLSANAAPEITYQARITTSDATVTTISAITLADLEMAQAFVTVQATKTDYSASLFGTINAGARRSGAGAVLIGTPIINSQEDSGATPAITADVSGNDLRFRWEGVAAENWIVVATIRYSIITD